MIEFLECVEVVLGSQELLAFDPERFRDQEGLLGDLGIEREDGVQLIGRKKIPEAHLATGGSEFRMVGDEPSLHLGVHAPVHATNALHEAHRVPVDVVVDHARGVLEVQAFGEDVGGNEDTDLGAARPGERRRRCPIVVR